MTRRTAFNGSASGRRRERRAALRMRLRQAQKYCIALLSRAQIQAKGNHETPKRIEDAKPINFMAQDAYGTRKSKPSTSARLKMQNMYANEFGKQNPPNGSGQCACQMWRFSQLVIVSLITLQRGENERTNKQDSRRPVAKGQQWH
jgi:hypothetical protein